MTNLNKEKLLELFIASIDNGTELLTAAQHLIKDYEGEKFPSLGLAEIALEEFGKAYTCLAYYSKADQAVNWQLFWKDWKNHDVKAHRAFLFEFFCPLRTEVVSEELKEKLTLRGTLSKEKEYSFYVDINKTTLQVLVPKKEIKDVECFNRIASLFGILNASLHIKEWMVSSNSTEFKKSISDYAFRVMTEKFYQQDVKRVLEEMKTKNNEYNSGLEAINKLFHEHVRGA